MNANDKKTLSQRYQADPKINDLITTTIKQWLKCLFIMEWYLLRLLNAGIQFHH